MDTTTKRKLNLLIHLAKVDGKFHDAEKALIKEFVNEKGFSVSDFDMLHEEEFQDVHLMDDKKEILYLALKLMQADKVIDRAELAFCRDLAQKLGYKPAVVDAFADADLDRTNFENEVAEWAI